MYLSITLFVAQAKVREANDERSEDVLKHARYCEALVAIDIACRANQQYKELLEEARAVDLVAQWRVWQYRILGRLRLKRA